MNRSLRVDLSFDEVSMTEKQSNQDLEQTDSDVTVTLSNQQSSDTLSKPTSLPNPASLLGLGKLCPSNSRCALDDIVGSILGSMSETEKRLTTQTNLPTPTSAATSMGSDRFGISGILLADTDQSGLNTGRTTASGQTAATSPAVSTPSDQALSWWTQRMSQLGPEKRLSPFSSQDQRSMHTYAGFSDIVREVPQIEDLSSKKPQPASTSPKHSAALACDKVTECRALADRTIQNNKVSDTATSPASPLVKTSYIQGCNPLAIEWSPIDKTENTATNKCLASSEPPSAWLEQPLLERQKAPISIAEPKESKDVLNWVDDIAPRTSEGKIIRSPFDNTRTLISHADTTGVTGDDDDQYSRNSKRLDSFAFQGTATVAPIDVSPLYQKPTLAQRRAEKQLGHSLAEVVQSARSTTRLRPVTLHNIPNVGVSATRSSLQVTIPAAPQGTPSQPSQPVSHTQSLTWKRSANNGVENHPVTPEFTAWTKVEQDLLRMGLIKRIPGKAESGSFVVPRSFEQWLQFRADRAEEALAENAEKVRRKSSEAKVAEQLWGSYSDDNIRHSLGVDQGPKKRVKIESAMGGRKYRDGRSAVLSHPTMWSTWYQPTEIHPEAPWPCLEEMKEEGDERHTSSFGRFPALPRTPGNPTVVWKVKPVIPALPFDEVWKLPDRDTWAQLYYQKLGDADEKYMECLIGQSLLDALNA